MIYKVRCSVCWSYQMIERFKGKNDHTRLIEAIKAQAIVREEEALAVALCERLKLIEFGPGDLIISQDGADQDLYLILAGKVSVRVNGRQVDVSGAGENVGEMA